MPTLSLSPRLERTQKELLRQKEDLLKESKSLLTVMDNVKVQVDSLMKVRPFRSSLLFSCISTPVEYSSATTGSNRRPEKSFRPGPITSLKRHTSPKLISRTQNLSLHAVTRSPSFVTSERTEPPLTHTHNHTPSRYPATPIDIDYSPPPVSHLTWTQTNFHDHENPDSHSTSGS